MEEQLIPDVEQELKKMQRKRAFAIIILANVIFLILSAASLFGVAMSAILIGSGEENPVVWFIASVVTGFPVVFLISLCGWIFYKKKKYTAAIVFSLLPLLNVLAFVAVYFLADAASL